jgi:hypothetical protein
LFWFINSIFFNVQRSGIANAEFLIGKHPHREERQFVQVKFTAFPPQEWMVLGMTEFVCPTPNIKNQGKNAKWHNKAQGNGKPPIQAELKHQMGTQMAWWCFLDKTTPSISRIKGSMPNGTTMLEATIGTMLEPMLGTTLKATFGMMLGKANMERRRETTAKMKTEFLILMATDD